MMFIEKRPEGWTVVQRDTGQVMLKHPSTLEPWHLETEGEVRAQCRAARLMPAKAGNPGGWPEGALLELTFSALPAGASSSDGSAVEPSESSEPAITPAAGDDRFNFQLLGRLKQDCDYFLGFGNRATKRLWAGDVSEQIQKMKELYAGFTIKPEWLSMEDIEQYEAEMSAPVQQERVRG